ncbi:MAG: hypothetical protein ACRD08_00075 [Acidimicrobiales bacterium]
MPAPPTVRFLGAAGTTVVLLAVEASARYLGARGVAALIGAGLGPSDP